MDGDCRWVFEPGDIADLTVSWETPMADLEDHVAEHLDLRTERLHAVHAGPEDRGVVVIRRGSRIVARAWQALP